VILLLLIKGWEPQDCTRNQFPYHLFNRITIWRGNKDACNLICLRVSLSLCVWDRGQRHHDNAQLFSQKGTRRRCANVGRLVQMISAFSRSRCCVCVSGLWKPCGRQKWRVSRSCSTHPTSPRDFVFVDLCLISVSCFHPHTHTSSCRNCREEMFTDVHQWSDG
jgi:hypothetical protein